MTDEKQTPEEEEVVEQIEDQNPPAEPAAKEKSAAKAAAPSKKEKVDERVESHEKPDLGKQLSELTERLVKLETRPTTRVYIRKSERKENSDGLQTKEEKAAGKSKPRSGKFKLWRTI